MVGSPVWVLLSPDSQHRLFPTGKRSLENIIYHWRRFYHSCDFLKGMGVALPSTLGCCRTMSSHILSVCVSYSVGWSGCLRVKGDDSTQEKPRTEHLVLWILSFIGRLWGCGNGLLSWCPQLPPKLLVFLFKHLFMMPSVIA